MDQGPTEVMTAKCELGMDTVFTSVINLMGRQFDVAAGQEVDPPA